MTKLVFETDVLAAALRDVRGAVQRRNTIPILSNVMIDAQADGTVRLTCSDLDVMVTRTLSAGQVDADVGFTVDAHRLADVVGAFASGSQTIITFERGAAIVTSGRARTRFSTLPRDDFPILLQKAVNTQFEIAAKALTRAIGVVRHAISTEETRYYLNGVYWHVEDGKLIYASTDGHRLARYVDDLPDGAESMQGVILRTRCIDLIRSAAEARDLPVGVAVGDDKVTMTAGDFTMVAKVVDGTYPDYTRVLPSSHVGVVQVDRDAFEEAVSRVTVAVTDKVRAVKLEVETDRIRALVTSPEHGEAVDEVPCAYASPAGPLTIGFNGRYLRDALQVLDVDQVEIRLGDAATVAVLSSPKASGVTLALMPMRV